MTNRLKSFYSGNPVNFFRSQRADHFYISEFVQLFFTARHVVSQYRAISHTIAIHIIQMYWFFLKRQCVSNLFIYFLVSSPCQIKKTLILTCLVFIHNTAFIINQKQLFIRYCARLSNSEVISVNLKIFQMIGF